MMTFWTVCSGEKSQEAQCKPFLVKTKIHTIFNPLAYAYQEIRKPKYMILPKPVLPDADGDGITDQFDQEQTPQGCPVDSHGVSLDTDGDGVPDCRDKEKVTPTY